MRYAGATFYIVFFVCCQQGFGQTCCSGGVPLSNNIGLPNDGKGILHLGLNYDYNNLNTLNAGSERLLDDSRKRITNSVLLGLGYAITAGISVEALFTWVNQTRTITQFGNENFTETTGIGDAVVLAKYSFNEILGSRSVLNVGSGVKLPLGQSDMVTAQGILLTADLQPGSGAWDGLGWLSLSKAMAFRESAAVSGSISYRLTGKNKDYLNNTSVYQFGDEMQLNLGYTDQFLLFNTIINPGLILKYRKAKADKINALHLPNTGGEWVFIRPELTARISPSWGIALRLEVPLYSYVEGSQLTPTLRVTTGLYYKLNIKQQIILNSTL